MGFPVSRWREFPQNNPYFPCFQLKAIQIFLTTYSTVSLFAASSTNACRQMPIQLLQHTCYFARINDGWWDDDPEVAARLWCCRTGQLSWFIFDFWWYLALFTWLVLHFCKPTQIPVPMPCTCGFPTLTSSHFRRLSAHLLSLHSCLMKLLKQSSPCRTVARWDSSTRC